MTVTISLDELIAHENAMQKWLTLRADAQWHCLSVPSAARVEFVLDYMWKWEKENPRPTLIPYQRERIEYRFRFQNESGESGGITEMAFAR